MSRLGWLFLFIQLKFSPGLSFLMFDHSVASFLHEGGKCVPVYSFALFNNLRYVNNIILLEILDGFSIEGTIVLLNMLWLTSQMPILQMEHSFHLQNRAFNPAEVPTNRRQGSHFHQLPICLDLHYVIALEIYLTNKTKRPRGTWEGIMI